MCIYILAGDNPVLTESPRAAGRGRAVSQPAVAVTHQTAHQPARAPAAAEISINININIHRRG